ncbi:unnamed protein product [Fraxinus pennsylvanica]|uniref:Uncharacterized protein n=1 Tax=Fraxinus pennsylvanica TaxID=56036 RepID=A0AAD2E0P8_9LAMI|nr:unnamed protein product [Fraxinus pennsylvanica]
MCMTEDPISPPPKLSPPFNNGQQSNTSGAIQYGVPTTECVFTSASVNFVATPKSASFTRVLSIKQEQQANNSISKKIINLISQEDNPLLEQQTHSVSLGPTHRSGWSLWGRGREVESERAPST